jgi:hypothetical protein
VAAPARAACAFYEPCAADERGSIIAHASATAAISQINKYDPYGIAGAGVSGRFRDAGAPSLAAPKIFNRPKDQRRDGSRKRSS